MAPLSPEVAAELKEAWADLDEAAKVLNLHACKRGGRDWREDPDSVRAVVGLLRKYGASGDLAK
jgi:hypothetical protein